METVTTPQAVLWAGVELKLDHVNFHLDGMSHALRPPEPPAQNVPLHAMGTNIDGNRDWQRAFFAHLDAFLSAARSVPEIIRCCFGVDDGGGKDMRAWFNALDPDEQDRRTKFAAQFKPHYDYYRKLPLVAARHVSEHRRGFPPVQFSISGRFGVTYTGDPVTPVPITETRRLEGDFGWMETPTRIHPRGADFNINGQRLLDACRAHIEELKRLADRARELAHGIHGDGTLSPPPDDL